MNKTMNAGKRALLALVIAGVAIAAVGCFSVHVHHETETDHPAPVIVVPPDHPNQ